MKKHYVYVCEYCGRQSKNEDDILNCELFHSKREEYLKKILGDGSGKYYGAIWNRAMAMQGSFAGAVSHYIKKGVESEIEEYKKEIDAVMDVGGGD